MRSTPPAGTAEQTCLFTTPALSSAGVEFDPNEDDWKLDRSVILKFDRLVGICTPRFFHQTKTVAKILAETSNARSVTAAFRKFRDLAVAAYERRSTTIDVVETEDLLDWTLRGNNRRYIAQLRIFTKVSKTFATDLLTDDAQHLLDNMNAALSSNELESVRTWDPTKGALRPAEDKLLSTLINAAFTSGNMSLRAFFIVRMLRGFGMRPIQLGAMKVSDIRDGAAGMHVRIPKAKQRNAQ